MTMENFDVDQYRREHESSREWGLKKSFLLAHKDKFEERRLLCLASCFINVECYGSTYPPGVMQQLRELMTDIMDVLEEYRAENKELNEVKFVKAGESASSTDKPKSVDTVFPSSSAVGTSDSNSGPKPKPLFGGFVKASEGLGSSNNEPMEVSSSKSTSSSSNSKFKSLFGGFVKASANVDDVETDNANGKTMSNELGPKDPWGQLEPTTSSQSNLTSSPSNPTPSQNNPTSSQSNPTPSPNNPTSSQDKPASSQSAPGTPVVDKPSPSIPLTGSAVLDKFRKFGNMLSSIPTETADQVNGNKHVDTMHKVADKLGIALTSEYGGDGLTGFNCQVYADGIKIGLGMASKKKISRIKGYRQAFYSFVNEIPVNIVQGGLKFVKRKDGMSVENKLIQGSPLNSPKLSIVSSPANSPNRPKGTDSPNRPRGTDSPNRPLVKNSPNRPARLRDMYNNLILIENLQNVKKGSVNEMTILNHTSHMNKINIEYDFRGECVNGQQLVTCSILIEEIVFASHSDINRQEAKKKVSEIAHQMLKEKCWTIKIKKATDTDEAGLTRDEVTGVSKHDVIPDSNVGCKLLKKMGWSGGGMGKDGAGIDKPVSLDSVMNRAGLGHMSEKGIAGNFADNVKRTIENYIKSDDQNDLVFSSDLTKEERAIVHKACTKYNLKSQSYGVGKDRHLALSRKRTAQELFIYIQSQGGETSKYLLIPPGCD